MTIQRHSVKTPFVLWYGGTSYPQGSFICQMQSNLWRYSWPRRTLERSSDCCSEVRLSKAGHLPISIQ
jgi:hypothetical protein